MGCCNSKLDRQESISRCKARRRYMKQLVRARQSFSFSHSLYLHSLRSTGSALVEFANSESSFYTPTPHMQSPPQPKPMPQPQPPQLSSPAHSTWTISSSIPASPILPPPPNLPNTWDFWDPFGPSSSSHHLGPTHEEWDEVATTVSPVSATLPPSPKGQGQGQGEELAMVVAGRRKKELVEVVKELDEYFLKAADSGARVSFLLESPSCLISTNSGVLGKIGSYGRSLSPIGWPWGSNNSKNVGFTKFGKLDEENGIGSHSSTVVKLYAWEQKLFSEVKNSERLREEYEKRLNLLRRQELKGTDYVKIEKNKMEIEALESKMMVASQTMETTSSEITRLRESELFPQLLELVNCLMGMWRSMYECHQVQTHIVQQLTHLTSSTSSTSSTPTSDSHRQSTLQLNLEVDRWHSSFCNLVKSHRDYIHSLTGWLRLSLFQTNHRGQPLSKNHQPESSNLYSLCEEWYLALDRIPDKVASEGIKSFLTVIHAIVLQQAEELKQKNKSERAFKDLDKRANELRALESKHGVYSTSILVSKKRAKVDFLKVKAEEEKAKYEKSSASTRAMTVNNLQTGFPNVFQAITGFSGVCMQGFEGVYNFQRRSGQALDLKLLT